ncbi:MAG: hypothetical protein CL592_00075 [Alteromonas sp.]|nr:hypothetical protein [Alteromonas sp.]|tara:strand:- start:9575 stop:10969 length:1395 start_codon:yes stop_codon:yes gene_type:complete
MSTLLAVSKFENFSFIKKLKSINILSFVNSGRSYLSFNINSLFVLVLLIANIEHLHASQEGTLLASYSDVVSEENNLFDNHTDPNDNIFIKYSPASDESVYRVSWFINNKWVGKPEENTLTFPDWPLSLDKLGEGIHKIEARIFGSQGSPEYRTVNEYLLVTSEIANGARIFTEEIAQPQKNYVRVIHSETRGLNAITTVEDWNAINVDQTTGFVLQIDWHDLTPDLQFYTFDVIDELLEKKRDGDKVWIKLMDRTFHSGCSKQWYPEGIKVISGKNNTCYADHTDTQTFEAYKSTLETLASYYNDNADVEGFIFNETAYSVYNVEEKAIYFGRLIRYHNAIQNTSPEKFVVQYLNWPNEYKLFEKFVQNFLTWGNYRGGIGWPDSVPDELNAFQQYEIARDYGDSLLIFPGAQGALLDLCSETPSIKTMLEDNLNVDMVVWENWSSNCDYQNVLLDFLYLEEY